MRASFDGVPECPLGSSYTAQCQHDKLRRPCPVSWFILFRNTHINLVWFAAQSLVSGNNSAAGLAFYYSGTAIPHAPRDESQETKGRTALTKRNLRFVCRSEARPMATPLDTSGTRNDQLQNVLEVRGVNKVFKGLRNCRRLLPMETLVLQTSWRTGTSPCPPHAGQR